MFKKRLHAKKKFDHGQGIVEFAIVLPVVLMLVFGIIEIGFLLFSYSSVNSASREAARYGIAIGDVGASQRYYDCDGILTAGMRIGRFAGMDTGDFSIAYDSGPGSAIKYTSCADLASHGGNDSIRFGDRIVVSVSHDYHPLVAIMGLNINPFNMTSTSSRTIVKDAEIIPGGGSSAPGGGGGTGSPACYGLTRAYFGSGTQPSVSISNSVDCPVSSYTYTAGEVLTLTAHPSSGWIVSSWSGTNNDASTTLTNTVTMPAADHTVTVNYAAGTPTCYTLTLTHSPASSGSDPTASPASSSGCGADSYVSGEVITLTANPNLGYIVDSWSGTNDDSSTANTNTWTMQASNHTISVTYIIGP